MKSNEPIVRIFKSNKEETVWNGRVETFYAAIGAETTDEAIEAVIRHKKDGLSNKQKYAVFLGKIKNYRDKSYIYTNVAGGKACWIVIKK